MARKPNYRFERFERDRQRTAKKAARAKAKADKKAEKVGVAPGEEATTETAEGSPPVAEAPDDGAPAPAEPVTPER
jgi:hypothetical protein